MLAWFDRHGRDLPCAHARSYRVLVSEFILQQTSQ